MVAPLIRPPVEITEPVALCAADGRLNKAARGWARCPLFHTALPGPFLRRKRWNFVFVSHPEVLLAVALSHADYSGLAFVWMYDLRRQRFLELEQLAPLGMGVRLGTSVDDDAAFVSGPLQIDWRGLKADGTIAVAVRARRTKSDERPLELRLRIHRRSPATALEDESLNLIVPWSDTRFNYTGKLVALSAEGELLAGGERYVLGPAETLASIDCTRGIWPYRTTWNWACGAGRIGTSKRIGLNFGAGWSESAGVLENALFVDGKILPLWEKIAFQFDAARPFAPWTMRTVDSDRVFLTFTPAYSRTQDTNLLVVRMKLLQVMGSFSGRLILNAERGEFVQFEGLPGIAENHLARW